MTDPTTDDLTAPGDGPGTDARPGSPGCAAHARKRARATTRPVDQGRATRPTTTTRPHGRPRY
ncbi:MULTISPECIES: hypothetical protein [Actinosynnema]|uniref:hypothetical protein n=1 Tax=Actinosynnema TaxID=40566 RepID=UPI0020A5F2D9|nr:hypothetical protein [Actinosynnema pretiosum]MCP2098485.1 hypothetical protein [Actinosynnema pretiosum]